MTKCIENRSNIVFIHLFLDAPSDLSGFYWKEMPFISTFAYSLFVSAFKCNEHKYRARRHVCAVLIFYASCSALSKHQQTSFPFLGSTAAHAYSSRLNTCSKTIHSVQWSRRWMRDVFIPFESELNKYTCHVLNVDVCFEAFVLIRCKCDWFGLQIVFISCSCRDDPLFDEKINNFQCIWSFVL